ncbi:hypothetical protein [Parasitella parasitica]|uniref:Uncharacterized protein n=1 Tax=Parasitella parasitica TaxID=35722 RepID=A0A0B7N7Z5_9FUNG|nr:hypothetical protein [Parasitella parasitica]
MDSTLVNIDINQLPSILQQFQNQLTAVQEKVQQHENLLLRLDLLEKENEVLKKNLQAREQEIKILHAKLSAPATTSITLTTKDEGNKPAAAKKSKNLPDLATEIKKRLAFGPGVDLGRILDICFPASDLVGILRHVQYVTEITDRMKVCLADVIPSFDPLDPKNITDPKYDSLSTVEREDLSTEFVNTRCGQTLTFLRPLNVSGVGHYFAQQGWI